MAVTVHILYKYNHLINGKALSVPLGIICLLAITFTFTRYQHDALPLRRSEGETEIVLHQREIGFRLHVRYNAETLTVD